MCVLVVTFTRLLEVFPRLSCAQNQTFVPVGSMDNENQPTEALVVYIPISTRRTQSPGPVPPKFWLDQNGLYRSRIEPLRTLMLACPLASISRYLSIAPASVTCNALPSKLATF